MHIARILQENKPSFSFEFFPPKTLEASSALFDVIKELTPLKPSYVSVTYGAGGSTRQLTHDLLVRLRRETDLTIVAHLTCVGSTKDEMERLLSAYEECGIENILALKGDPPRGSEKIAQPENGFAHAADLVAFIKHAFPKMGVGVAGFAEGHPEMPNRLKEIEYLKAKVDAGADYICTQLFFENRDFYDFSERCEISGITVPIIAGIMPITSRKGLTRMAELALGARFPAKLLRALSRAENDEYVEKVGVHWATEQIRDLIDRRAAGVHFYTLNRSKATMHIYESLGVRSSDGLKDQPVDMKLF